MGKKKEELEQITKEKNEDKVKIDFETKRIPELGEVINTLKVLSVAVTILLSIIGIVMIILGTLTTLTVKSDTKEQLLNNAAVVDYIKAVNGYSISRTEETITEMENKTWFMVYNVIVPTVAIFVVIGLLIKLNILIYNMIKDVKTDKDIFTEKKLDDLKRAKSIFSWATLILILVIDISYFIILIIVECTLDVIMYLFNYAVKHTSEK